MTLALEEPLQDECGVATVSDASRGCTTPRAMLDDVRAMEANETPAPSDVFDVRRVCYGLTGVRVLATFTATTGRSARVRSAATVRDGTFATTACHHGTRISCAPCLLPSTPSCVAWNVALMSEAHPQMGESS